jgi:hypothetical protein
MKRIVYAVARGKPRFAEMAMGLGRSLRLIGDKTPRVIVTDIKGYDWHRYFDEVLPPNGPRSSLDKLTALERTDADQVISLDVDMLAFKRLDPIFDYCNGKDFAVLGHPETEGVFHGLPVPEILKRYGLEWMPRFNAGIVYYERQASFFELLAAMREAEATYDQHGFEVFRGGTSEEVCELMGMIKLGRFHHLIEPETQFQHSAAGLIGKLYLDVRKNECRYISRQRYAEFYEPYLFHAWRYKDFLIYWKQLEHLKAIERWEDRHGTMYMSRFARLRRSVERRILKMRGLALEFTERQSEESRSSDG